MMTAALPAEAVPFSEATVLPARIRDSPLMARGGFVVLDALPAPVALDAFQAEADAHLASASEHRMETADFEEVHGGHPARRFLSAPGGPTQDALYHHPSTLALLGGLTGLAVRPSGGRGTYNYYARPGDFLGLHRDVDACNLAVITCLTDTLAGTGRGGGLCLWPTRYRDPLSALRAAPAEGARKLPLAPGQTLVFFGGVIPHLVLPTAQDQYRAVSILCYEV